MIIMGKSLYLLLILSALTIVSYSRSIASEDNTESSVEKRNAEKPWSWSADELIEMKREIPQLLKRLPSLGQRYFDLIPKELAEEKRQHWSYGFGPGGKRDASDFLKNDKRQHWSYGFAPGGKREFFGYESMPQDDAKRHLLYEEQPQLLLRDLLASRQMK